MRYTLRNQDKIAAAYISYWDIHEKRYTVYEIAARFLRMKGYNVRIEIGDNTENPSYYFGYIRFYRYVEISFN